MISSHPFILFYLTSFRDYKKYWLKTCLSCIGLVLSISLVTAVSIYVDTIDFHLKKQDVISQVYPSSYLTHDRGSLRFDEIQSLLETTSISHGYPFAKRVRNIQFNKQTLLADIVGVDFIYLSSFFLENESLSQNTDVVMIFNDPQFDRIDSMDVTLKDHNLSVEAVYDASQTKPLVIMDISKMTTIMELSEVDRFYIDGIQFTEDVLNCFPGLRLETSSQDPSQLSRAFFINLQFIGMFSAIISTLLIYLFFRFIQKHRRLTDHLLGHLGISAAFQRQLRWIESLFFVCITSLLGVGLGIFLSSFGLDVLTKTMNTLYYVISMDSLIVRPVVFLKAFLISLISVFFAMNQRIQRLERLALSLSPLKQWSLSIIMTLCGVILILLPWQNMLIAYRAIAGLIICVFFVSLMSISLVSSFFLKLKSSYFLALKTASYYIRRDIILSSMMVVSISLACGLFISMSLFIHSFQQAISEWIIKSTQDDVYIQAPYNTIPNPVPLSVDDVAQITTHSSVITWQGISRDNITINGFPIILRGLSYDQFNDQIQWIVLDDSIQLDSLDKKAIFISEAASKKLGVGVGDSLSIPTGSEFFISTVNGIYVDYASEQGVITISNEIMKTYYHDQFEYHGLSLTLDPDALSLFVTEFDHLIVQTNKELQAYVIKMFKQTFSLTWVLASISGLIALFVLINMVSVMTIDRRHEMIQLFTLGAQKHHIRQFVYAHTLWIGVISLIISLCVGAGLSFIILKLLTPGYFGWVIPYRIPYQPISFLMGAMVSIIVGTGWFAYRYVWYQISHYGSVYESLKIHYFSR